MRKQTRLAISYVQNYLSFLILDVQLKDNVSAVYLYGSAVRGELGKNSDIDLFIDTKDENIKKNVKAALSCFYHSRDYKKWQHLRFTYPLTIEVGVLKTWELKKSILSEGILLYAKSSNLLPKERFLLFTINLPKEKKNYLQITRKLFGRRERDYKDAGLVGEVGGEKLGSTVFMIPQQEQSKVVDFLQKKRIDYSFKEIAVVGA